MPGLPRRSLEQRFWEKVHKTEGCWEWRAAKNKKGYGMIGEGGGHGRNLKAPRVAWELMIGPIPNGICVLHKCDHPGCVRPDHLFLGTRGDNFRDCITKKRRPLGNPKLTPEQVREIRQLNGTQQTIADRFGVNRALISYIKNGKIWHHVI